MTSENNLVPLGVFDLTVASHMKAELRKREVEVEVVTNKATCSTGGCRPTVEVWVDPSKVDEIREYFAKENNKLLDGREVDPEQINQVFDPDKETATCPACGTSFPTANTECPDCGLSFA